MILFLFDCGGTIINDPFPAAMRYLHEDLKAQNIFARADVVDMVLASWTRENANFSFPLASHFLQEEVWPLRALRQLDEKAVLPSDIPLLGPKLLSAYRVCAKRAIQEQPQLAGIRHAFEWLRQERYLVGVASNDRDFATRSMLTWAGLVDCLRWIFTSDGFSSPGSIIEKPSAKFFEKAESEVARDIPDADIAHKVYIGDNERNDVELPLQLGYKTIRYINRENPKDATWLDHRVETSAHYKYDNSGDLLSVLQRVTNDLQS